MASPAGTDSAPSSGRAQHHLVKRLASTRGHARELATLGADQRRVVVERIDTASLTLAERDALLARAKVLASTVSPHLPRVLETSHDGATLTLVSTWAAGEWLETLLASEERERTSFMALAVGLRVVLDVLAALTALHSAKSPTPLMHGRVGPRHILVGLDGHSRLTGALYLPGPPLAEDAAHLAPEILLGDGTADTRADVYSASVLLWEALSGERLFTERTVEAVLARQLAGPMPRAKAREAWAEPLVEVAARGLAVDPAQRYAGMNEIAMAVRMIAQARLAAPTRVGRAVESLGEAAGAQRRSQRAGALSTPPATDVLERSGTRRLDTTPEAAAPSPPRPPSPSAPRLPATPPPVPKPRDSERTLTAVSRVAPPRPRSSPDLAAPPPPSSSVVAAAPPPKPAEVAPPAPLDSSPGGIPTPHVAFSVVAALARGEPDTGGVPPNAPKVAREAASSPVVAAPPPPSPSSSPVVAAPLPPPSSSPVVAAPPPPPSSSPIVPPVPSSDAVLDVAGILPPGVPPPASESELELVDVEVYSDAPPPVLAEPSGERRKRTGLVLLLLGGAVLLLLAGAVMALVRRGEERVDAVAPRATAPTSIPTVSAAPPVVSAAVAPIETAPPPSTAEAPRATPPEPAPAPSAATPTAPVEAAPTVTTEAPAAATGPTGTTPPSPAPARKPRKPKGSTYEPEGI